MNLNNGDVQSKAIYTTDGIVNAIYSGECRHGGANVMLCERRTDK